MLYYVNSYTPHHKTWKIYRLNIDFKANFDCLQIKSNQE